MAAERNLDGTPMCHEERGIRLPYGKQYGATHGAAYGATYGINCGMPYGMC